MDFTTVENQLSDLPWTFKRPGPMFSAWMRALTAICARNTIAIDAIYSKIFLTTASWGWLDTIGRLYNIPRNPYETDPAYRTRILGTLSAPHATPIAISNFIKLAMGLNSVVTENLGAGTYAIDFSIILSTQTMQNVVSALNWVRPVGVPFLPIYQVYGGLFLNTCNFFGVKRVSGSYLVTPKTSANVVIPAYITNPKPLLPTIYLTDPFITGQVPPP